MQNVQKRNFSIITGYVRIFLALVSFFFMRTNYVISCTCYLLSVILDEFDGVAARLLNQVICVKFERLPEIKLKIISVIH